MCPESLGTTNSSMTCREPWPLAKSSCCKFESKPFVIATQLTLLYRLQYPHLQLGQQRSRELGKRHEFRHDRELSRSNLSPVCRLAHVSLQLGGVPNDLIQNWNALTIVCCAPLINYGLYPAFSKAGYPISPMWRMAIVSIPCACIEFQIFRSRCLASLGIHPRRVEYDLRRGLTD